MTTYDLDLERTPAKRGRKRSPGCAIVGWGLFALLFAIIVYFGYRVSVYYGKIRRGEIIDLPQFTARFTSVTGRGASGPWTVGNADVDSADAPSAGPAAKDAKLTIVQFADFQCPYSKEEATVFRTLMAKYGDRVRFVFRDYPLDAIHPDAMQAALASECAGEQGKFWNFHDKLFLNSPALTFADLTRYAEETGLDTKQFEKCLVDERYKSRVDADRAAAEGLGLTGTPSFFLNGQRIEGAIPEPVFDGLIQKLLK
ncbi:MAG: hypothetical protein RL272_49 [Candidatus Parcubacteria bacterium]|jgi:protein-disulfide isomerase